MAATPEWHARSNGVDVYFFALSGVVQFLCEHLEAANSTDRELVLVTAAEPTKDDSARGQEKALLHIVRHALIHRHGIATSIGMKRAADDEQVDEEEDGDAERGALTAVFSPTADAAAKQLARIAGLVPVDRTLVVVDESLHTKSALPQALTKCAGVLSVADLTDSVLQRVREQLRAGVPPVTIQLSIFEEFGEQSALLHRADDASDFARYI
jgi:hypothetical protein